ncbi:hypothetical protein [Pelagicoccus sp. SDUM812005]|uniref:hypothetical protein n=1 Tax=Pelagicoccus sp. SDUM812005 TaxID=3041257 RepID=UPI00280CD4A7|nr:hypothetical protein [Pelagicoccus sp. SDUM812005]MDQ8182960.1 hypothetical protein [Pelagicoccus sp. SDUM812005]
MITVRFTPFTCLAINIFLFIQTLTAGELANPTKQEQQIKMQIGDIQISNYIYERELNRSFKKKPRHEISEDEEESWRAEWINKLLLVCEAKSQGYDKAHDVIRSTEILTNHMLTNSPNGPYAKWLFAKFDDEANQDPKKIRQLIIEDGKKILTDSKKTENIAAIRELLANSHPTPQFEHQSKGLSKALFEYYEDGFQIKVKAESFLNHYNRSVIKKPLNTVKNISSEIDSFIIQEKRKKLSLSLKLDQSWHFSEERENFKNNTIYNKYLELEIHPRISTSEDKLKTFFEANRTNFTAPKTIKFLISESKNKNEARQFLLHYLRSHKKENLQTPQYNQLQDASQVLERNIQITDNNFSKHRDLGLFSANTGNLTRATINADGNFNYCFILDKSGIFYPKFESVIKEVRTAFRKESEKKEIRSTLEQISEKYKVSINLTTDNQ